MTRWQVATLIVGAVALATGCSSNSPSTPPAGVGGSAPVSSTSAAAPPVSDPLPASVFDKHPCESALTTAQLNQLINVVPPARHTDNQAGPSCGWTKPSPLAIIDVAWMTGVHGGLSQVVAAQQNAPFHESTTVSGYPGLSYNSEQPTHDCHVAVGIADSLVFDVAFGADAAKVSPCDGATQVAQKVLANLKAAAGK